MEQKSATNTRSQKAFWCKIPFSRWVYTVFISNSSINAIFPSPVLPQRYLSSWVPSNMTDQLEIAPACAQALLRAADSLRSATALLLHKALSTVYCNVLIWKQFKKWFPWELKVWNSNLEKSVENKYIERELILYRIIVNYLWHL